MPHTPDTERPIDKPAYAFGAYGCVELHGNTAIKTAKLYNTHGDSMLLPNMSEAIYAAMLIRHEADVGDAVRYKSVHMDATAYAAVLEVERGLQSLHDHVKRMPEADRFAVLEVTMRHLVRALHVLHSHGLVHGDLKPGNIVVTEASPVDFRVRLIDLGSTHMYGRTQVCTGLCTYQFAPPEMFMEAVDCPLMDAFSLGAVLFYLVHERHVFNIDAKHTFRDVRKMHKSGRSYDNIDHYRRLVDSGDDDRFSSIRQTYRIITRLLDSNPSTRLSVAELFTDLFGHQLNALGVRAHITNLRQEDVVASWHIAPHDDAAADDAAADGLKRRRSVMRGLFERLRAKHAPLTCCMLDKLAVATRSAPSITDIQACVTITECILECDCADEDLTPEVRKAIVRVMDVLGCDVYSDTCDWLLVKQQGFDAKQLEHSIIQEAVIESCGNTDDAVSFYMRHASQATML
jgi:hypothetical protein